MQPSDHYQAISCEIHDGYELACIRRAVHKLSWSDGEHCYTELLRCLDLDCSDGQEFLLAENQSGEKFRIRLDKITSQLPY